MDILKNEERDRNQNKQYNYISQDIYTGAYTSKQTEQTRRGNYNNIFEKVCNYIIIYISMVKIPILLLYDHSDTFLISSCLRLHGITCFKLP